jgi:hypothetical protein
MAGTGERGRVYICDQCVETAAAFTAEADRDWRKRLLETLRALP